MCVYHTVENFARYTLTFFTCVHLVNLPVIIHSFDTDRHTFAFAKEFD